MFKPQLIGAALVALALASPVAAKPQSCMPNAPYGRAPQWAVDLVRQRGGDLPASPDDPIWQQAVCDQAKHTVTWRLPASDEDEASMRKVIVGVGETMQRNLLCKSGPISFDEFPLDPDVAEFVGTHRAMAHKLAMTGVQNIAVLAQQRGVAAVCASLPGTFTD
jgi:hypothetical protein